MSLDFSTEREPKRRTILAAASGLFLQHGYRRTSVEDIARAAGVAKGTVYLYFRDKEALFGALIAAYEVEIEAAADRAIGGDAAFDERLFGLLDAKYGTAFRLMHRAPMAREMLEASDAIAAERLKRFSDGYRARLEGFLRAGGDAARAQSGGSVTPVELARIVQGACGGLAAIATSNADFERLLRQFIGITFPRAPTP